MNFYARTTSLLVATIAFTGVALANPGIRESDLPDVLVKKDGSKVKCEVVREDPKEVRYKDTTGKEKTISNDSVDHLELKGFPEELGVAERAIERREYSKAIEAADNAIGVCGAGREKDLFLARARVAKAKALRGCKRYKEAATIAEQALEAGNNRWAGQAHVERVYSLACLNSEDCTKAFDDAAGKVDSFGDEYNVDIMYGVGLFYEKQKKTDQAKSKFSYVKNSTREEMRDRADLALGRVKLLENNAKAARDAFQSIVSKTRDPETLAGAYLGLGNAGREEALNASGDDKANGLRECVQLYLKGVILAIPMGNASTENHEANMREAAHTYEMILETIPAASKSPKDLQGRKYFMDEARKMYEDLYRNYPGAEDEAKVREKALELGKKSKEIQEALEKDKPAEK